MDQKYTNDRVFENLAWLTQKTEEPKCNKGNFTLPTPHTHTQIVNAIEL